MKKKAAKGHTVKHTKKATAKHNSAKVKHKPVHHAKAATAHKTTVHAKAKHPAHAKATALALDAGDVACCGAEALAASLRLGGLSVTDAEMLDLFWLAGGHPDKGIPLVTLLEAASEYGLTGVRPASFEPVDLAGCMPALNEQVVADFGDDLAVQQFGHGVDERLFRRDAVQFEPLVGLVSDRPFAHALILGVDLPGSHAVLATPEGWWSWGELWCPCEFPDAVIEEAWAVTWA